MSEDEYYTGIDIFRFFAALLVVSIHTSPLICFSETANFILTRVIARVAVPFFLMTSGFFVVSRYSRDFEKVKYFIKKTVIIYIISMLLYLPVNIYSGYFKKANLLPNIIKDLVFDGTLYHLWYLPASIIGAIISWCLVKKLDYKKALVIASMLYLIGLFGDSYFGMSEKIPVLKSFYDMLFQIFDYTRNGVFFAPVFMILGGLIFDSRFKMTLKKSIFGFAISFILMLAESTILHYYHLQRHDSMYAFLIPCVYFLFCAVLNFRGKITNRLRVLSLIIYIIHPMMIIVVRMFARFFNLKSLFVDNSIVHYIAVCIMSVIFSVLVANLLNKYRKKKSRNNKNFDRAYIEINLNNLSHNVKVLRNSMPSECELMAVVKTEAYGHGAYEISTYLDKIGVKAFAVATIDEGIKLRKYGVRGEILILGYTNVNRAGELRKYNLIQTVIDFSYAEQLNKQAVFVKVHIKIDTGMHRLGVLSSNIKEVKNIFTMKYLKVCGIFTHLCCSESLNPDDVTFTNMQIRRFYDLIDNLKNSGITIPKMHIQSSYGLLNYPDLKCDYIRAGIAIYGALNSHENKKTVMQLDLRPVLSLKTKIIMIRSVPAGDYVGYDRAFMAERDSKIAILPIGYGDGFPRNLSCGKGCVRIGQNTLPIIGRICMDQLAVDITDAEDVNIGDTVTLIDDNENNPLAVSNIAKCSDSISNELLCRMGARLNIKANN